MVTCNQSWRDDEGALQFCAGEPGHSGECRTQAGWLYSETVELV